MKIRRTVLVATGAVVLGLGVGFLAHPELFRHESFKPIIAEAVIQAIQRYTQASAERHVQLPEIVTLGQLVDSGSLSASDLGSSIAREYAVPMRGLADGTAPFTILHFPHKP